MARPPTIQVDKAELEALFIALDLWSKIRAGILASEAIPRARLPSHDFPGGMSDILRHKNTAGYQIATTHRIIARDGSVSHWDAKDIHVGSIVIFAS
jgi:hypothetical protein